MASFTGKVISQKHPEVEKLFLKPNSKAKCTANSAATTQAETKKKKGKSRNEKMETRKQKQEGENEKVETRRLKLEGGNKRLE